MAGEEVLHEALGAFKPRRGGTGSERLDARRLERIHQARHQRGLGSDDNEVDGILLGEGDEGRHVLRADGDALRFGGDAGVAGRAVQGLAQGRGGNRPAQGMFAAAAAHHQNPHFQPRIPDSRGSCSTGTGPAIKPG